VEGRRGRTIIAVDVAGSNGPPDADVRVAVGTRHEVALLTAITAVVRNPGLSFDEPLGTRAATLASQLSAARYSVIIADAEPAVAEASASLSRDPQRATALIALAQALNGPSRCALSTLRAGGNRSGAEAVLTSQTGYPTGVDFSRGFPVYRPHDARMSTDAALIVGDPSVTDLAAFARLPLAIIGPGASRVRDARVVVDTGVAGIHCGGTALRMDDVALPLRPSIGGHRDPADVIRALITQLAAGDGFTRAAGDGSEDPSLRVRRGDPSASPPSGARSAR
jgi:formylmethanofuran dehydrogenase subunit B